MAGFVRSALIAGVAALGCGFGAQQAGALDEAVVVTVNTNMARVLRIGTPAATVIIGNPAVADVTIQDPQTLVLTGKSFGRTNLIILNAHGEPIADTIVEVSQVQGDTLTVYMGAQRTSLACAPNCQPVIMLGDDTSYTSEAIAGSSMINDAAR